MNKLWKIIVTRNFKLLFLKILINLFICQFITIFFVLPNISPVFHKPLIRTFSLNICFRKPYFPSSFWIFPGTPCFREWMQTFENINAFSYKKSVIKKNNIQRNYHMKKLMLYLQELVTGQNWQCWLWWQWP